MFVVDTRHEERVVTREELLPGIRQQQSTKCMASANQMVNDIIVRPPATSSMCFCFVQQPLQHEAYVMCDNLNAPET